MNDSLIELETLSQSLVSRPMGLHLRKPTRGPEYELVQAYVEAHLPIPPHGQARTVFVEPRIASGFPDLVVAYWHIATAERWSECRSELVSRDLRILQYLAAHRKATSPRLRSAFPHGLAESLRRLDASNLITPTGKGWRVFPLERTFAVRRLIAIEAKITGWRDGLLQALQNTWFASESYLLLARIPKRSTAVDEALRLGIGLVVHGQALDEAEAPARREALPKSYASWLFNEWVWQSYIMRKDTNARRRAHDD